MPELSPPMDHGFHVPFIKKRLPDWTRHLAPEHIDNLTRARDPAEDFAKKHPQLYAEASPALHLALYDSQVRSNRSTQALAKTLKDFKGITEFAKPLLTEAMNKTFGQSPDLTKTMLFHLQAPNRVDEQTLLQAALRNFEVDEPFDEVALQETSALAPAGALQNELYDRREHYPFWSTRYKIRDKLSIKPGEFATLCRQLDLGQQYQAHLSTVFDTPGTSATVREQTITANKDLMRLQVQIARMKSDVSESAYATLLAILDGSPQPRIDGRAVAYSQLTALGSELSDVLIIGPVSRKPTSTLEDVAEVLLPVPVWSAAVDPHARIIVYIPGDPKHPVKEFMSLAAFAKDLAVRLRSRTFQRFIAGLLPQDESPRFFRRLKAQLKTQRWNPNPVWPGPPYNPEAYKDGMYEEVWNDDANLALSETFIDAEVFGARYEAHLARIKSNARLLAVPTAAVDHQAWIERLEHLAEWGLNILNVGAFFVPGLGEVMLLVTAVQLGREVYQGVEAWKEGDAEEAWGHLTSVMQNVAFMAVLGAVASKAPPVLASRFVDGMRKVTTPFGEPRLWNPDLVAYKSNVALDGVTPNALGQYELEGKTYIKLEGNAYEKTYDPELQQWRIQHPTDPEAFQPILQHNQLGAWRHLDERPLEWDRLTLLRRIGTQMDVFSDTQLQQISKVSGVSDDALRQMHIDHQAPPPRLAETIAAFSADRQVDDFILGLRCGTRLNGAAEFAVPLVLELPKWPVEEVLEVFEGIEYWGASQRYGAQAAQQSARPTIKISRAEVRAGKLPEIVLAALDDQQKIQLLGAHRAGPGADPVQMFRDRLANRALARRQSLFKRLHTPQPPTNPDIQRLQRNFPTLSTEAAQEVLNGSSARDLSRLRSSGKMSMRQAKAIRRHIQQAALNRALCGLRLDSMASAASDRLALHSLQYVPGWSAQLRVEVRAGFIMGPLLDSVGSATERPSFYLIKSLGTYRAFNAQGVALHSIPAHGRNLFESLVEVLPQAARDNLQGHQGQALREELVNYASAHREEMARVLNQHPVDGPGPSLRLPSGQLGYLANGRGAGFPGLPNAGLIARVRVLYPNISDEQASQFISGRLSAGDSHQQVFNLLNNRQRELEGLSRQLNSWIGNGAGQAARRLQTEKILRCWRNGLYRGLEPAFELDLRGADALPEWDADFSHVKTLRLNSGQLADDTGMALLARFSQLKKLDILVHGQDTAALAGKLPEWATVTDLSLAGLGQAYAPQFLRALEGMTQLESLSLWGGAETMDFSKLTNLRSLNLFGQSGRWPTGVLDLPVLEALNLQTVAIPDLPAELYTGHEALWRGLRLNWGALEPQAFRKAYNFVHDNPAHLVDETQMVADYCHKRLASLMPQDYSFATDALARFNADGVTGTVLLNRVDALRQQLSTLDLALNTWQSNPVRVEGEEVQAHHREVVADRVRECARNSLRARYAPDEPVAGPSRALVRSVSEVLDMTGLGALGDMPALGDTVFAHIRRLNLAGSRLTTAQVNEFLRAFPQLRTLELCANRLTELPQAFETLTELTALDLSFNELTITATTQARINRLSSLQTLNLAYNRVGSLDVSSLRNLQSLYLGHTGVTRWPNGALSLPRLRRLALNHSAITDIPIAALTGHDRLLGATLMQGCRLTPQGLAAVRAFAERTPSQTPMGITRAHLAAGRTGGDPEFFPVEVSDQPNLLLPQNLAPGDGNLPQTSAARLQRLDPQLGEAQAVERIDAWLARGLGATAIEARLLRWEQQQIQLINRLNEWIEAPASRMRRAWVNAVDRRRAANQLLESWRLTLRDTSGVEGTLDFTGLIIGDLPTMPFIFNHVVELDLAGVGLSANSEGFLRSFPRLRSLTLNQNGLGNLPEAVTQCQELTRVNATFNDIRANEPLRRQLRSLPRLQWLNLGENHLSEFDLTGLDQLQGLNLRGNVLRDWPMGVLQAPALTILDLTHNEIPTIPQAALLPEHANLMAGTNLFDNMLEPDEFIRLQEYLQETGRGLGFTQQDIDHLLAGFESSESSESGEGDLHPDRESDAAQKDRWFRGVAADSEKHAMWSAIMEQDATHDFAYILSQLRHTQDFQVDRLGLTQRVWRVMESAFADEALSERLMGLARALRHQATCGDGRILLFNQLEVEVFEYDALKSIAPEHKGRELLKLSRRLFRLSQVEEVASRRIGTHPSIDPAEIRLAYRIGLAQRLDLPEQPRGMLYANLAQVTAMDLDQAYTRIIAQEQTPVFNDQLIARKYWRDYLEEKYPAEFTRVQQQFQEKCAALEDKYADFNEAYFQELKTLEADNRVDRKNLLSELTSRELAEQATMT